MYSLAGLGTRLLSYLKSHIGAFPDVFVFQSANQVGFRELILLPVFCANKAASQAQDQAINDPALNGQGFARRTSCRTNLNGLARVSMFSFPQYLEFNFLAKAKVLIVYVFETGQTRGTGSRDRSLTV